MNSKGSYFIGAFFMPDCFVHGVIPVFPLQPALGYPLC